MTLQRVKTPGRGWETRGEELAPSHAVVYGVGLQGDFLGNVEVGKFAGRKVSIRYRAEQTGFITGVRLFLKVTSGYGAGTLGILHMELQTNDPNGDLPSGVVIATAIDDSNVGQGGGAGGNFKTISFPGPVWVQRGKIYHMVFTNLDPDPVANYFSLDDTINSTSTGPRQRRWSDQDMAMMTIDRNTVGMNKWTVLGRHTPIFNWIYQDGTMKGPGYINVASISGLTSIGGANEVRQTITPSYEVTFNRVWWWLYRLSAAVTQDIEVYIRDAAFEVLHTTKISADDIPLLVAYVTAPFHRDVTLLPGRLYYLHLRCFYGNSTDYKTFPLQDGTGQGFLSDMQFTDGKAQYSLDRGVTWNDSQAGTDRDWPFYFA